MTTFLEVLNFVKTQLRIDTTNTSEDTFLKQTINYSQLRYARRRQWPQLRDTGTITTTSAQSYDLESDFDILIDGGVRYYTATNSQIFLQEVAQNDAELWRGMSSVITPQACQVISGTTGATKKLQLLPTFTETGKTVEYAYLKKPATMTADADVLALPELAEAIAFDTCSNYMDWSRDTSNQAERYAMRANDAYKRALATCIQQ